MQASELGDHGPGAPNQVQAPPTDKSIKEARAEVKRLRERLNDPLPGANQKNKHIKNLGHDIVRSNVLRATENQNMNPLENSNSNFAPFLAVFTPLFSLIVVRRASLNYEMIFFLLENLVTF